VAARNPNDVPERKPEQPIDRKDRFEKRKETMKNG
jgi:hypothetical protein